jgi:hypothetical protein
MYNGHNTIVSEESNVFFTSELPAAGNAGYYAGVLGTPRTFLSKPFTLL